MILFINACVRGESRTRIIADHLLKKLGEPVSEIVLTDISFPKADEAFLEHRDSLLAEKKFDAPLFELANSFAAAEKIVIAAPYWDLSFPATLKQYLEQINVVGITFRYTEAGIPEGLCHAKELYYVTTAGGEFVPHDYGFGYIKALAENYYGIPKVRLIEARGLDIIGADADAIVQEAMSKLDNDAFGAD